METVDIIRDLLKTAMKGQKGEEKKKRWDEERDKKGKSKEDKRTCCGPVVVDLLWRDDADTWSNNVSRGEHTVFYAGEVFTQRQENPLVTSPDCLSLANRWESSRQGLL